jgi:hypothetical protein
VSLLRRIWQWLTHVEDDVVADCCRRGHPFTEANTYMRPDGRGRECRACRANRRRARRKSNQPAMSGRIKEG